MSTPFGPNDDLNNGTRAPLNTQSPVGDREDIARPQDTIQDELDFNQGALNGSVPIGNDPPLEEQRPDAPSIDASKEKSHLPGKTQEILYDRWNLSFPYRFTIVECDGAGRVLNAGIAASDDVLFPKFKFTTTEIVLNIPPSSLSLSLGFTGSVQATNKGILEENNGIVFRNISISGTTGMLPGRTNVPRAEGPKPGSVTAQISGIFPGAATAFNNAKSAFSNLFGDKPNSKDPHGSLGDDELQNTGYAQFWRLHNFFVEYAEAKRVLNGNKIRLVFYNPKDNQAYIITPQSFDLSRDAGNPLLYRYSIGMRSWQIPEPHDDEFVSAIDGIPTRENPSTLNNVFAKLNEARNAVSSASEVLRAAQSDVNDITQGLSQAILIVKDIVAFVHTVQDFFPTIIHNVDSVLTSALRALTNEFNRSGDTANLSVLRAAEAASPVNSTSSAIGFNEVGARTKTIAAAGAKAGSAASAATKNLTPSGETKNSENQSPSLKQEVIKQLSRPEVASSILITQLSIPAPVQAEIDNILTAANETTATQTQQLSDKMRELNDNFAYATGMMDPTYAKLQSLPAPKATRIPTEDDILISASIEIGREALLETLASGDIYAEKGLDPFAEANNSLPEKIETPLSALPVFVDKGLTLDDLAKKHLQDASRGKEIALLNKLRAPYIDEDGFNVPITNASGREFSVNSRAGLAIGQTVRINATGRPQSRRRILNIEKLSLTAYLITVDGAVNLATYPASTSPYINARLPGTVGSGDILLIPSADSADQISHERVTAATERMTYAERLFKTDMALSASGDLVMDTNHDFKPIYGYENAIQALKLKLQTEQGELSYHLGYGIDAQIGRRLTGSHYDQIADNIRRAIVVDPRFSDAFVNVSLRHTYLLVNVTIIAARGGGRIPLQFQIAI